MCPEHHQFRGFNDIHFEKYLSILSTGQITEKLCHLILKVYILEEASFLALRQNCPLS